MKITKRQLRRIIREEKAKILRMTESYGAPLAPPTPAAAGKFAVQMDDAMADAVQELQTAYINLEDLASGIRAYPRGPETSDEILMNLELVKNAIHLLGAVPP